MMFPRRLLYLSQLAIASAFSGIGARAKTRGRNVVVQVRGAVLNCSKSSSMSFHDNIYLPKSSHIVSIKSSNIAGMINDGDDSCIDVDFGSDACLVAVTGERWEMVLMLRHAHKWFLCMKLNGTLCLLHSTTSWYYLIYPMGDSGSGKSLLVSKAIDLITGGRAAPSLVPPSNGEQASASSVEMSEYILDLKCNCIITTSMHNI